MYIVDRIYKSLIYHMSQVVPSGIQVLDGEGQGVRSENTSNTIPSITVSLGDTLDAPIELGSFSFKYNVYYTIVGTSRLQRDALKSIVMSGLMLNAIGVYDNFNGFLPASGAIVERYAELSSPVMIRNVPDMESDRERFFWVAEAFTSIDVLGL